MLSHKLVEVLEKPIVCKVHWFLTQQMYMVSTVVHVFLVQYGPVQFGLVTMNSPGVTYRQACTYYPVTCDAAQLVQWLKEMRSAMYCTNKINAT